jgi:hypothetical protein
MTDGDGISDETREHLLAVFDEIADVLGLTEELALQQGMSSTWALFGSRLALLRSTVKRGKCDPDVLGASIDAFTEEYDAFVAAVLPGDRAINI